MSSDMSALWDHLQRGGERCAVRTLDATWSYAALSDAAAHSAAALRNVGFQPGDRLAVLAHPTIDVITLMLGAYRAGVAWVPINPQYRSGELGPLLEDCRPRMLLCEASLLDEVPPTTGTIVETLDRPAASLPCFVARLAAALPPFDAFPSVSDEAIAAIIYTSGTTGRSKGVQLSYRALVRGIGSLVDLWRFTERDVLSLMLPLFHVHGLGIGIHGALLRGTEILLHARFDADAVIDDFERRGATVFMGVPTMYRRLLARLEHSPTAAATLGRARLFTAGSAALPAEDFLRFEALTGHRILERYGMSETLLTLSNPYMGERRPGSVGLPIPGVEILIADDDAQPILDDRPGELWVKAPGMMTGYWERPDADGQAFTPDGWFRTGDIVTRARDGYVSIVGRSSVDIIKSGGFKIGAREIEDALLRHPWVQEVAVYGLPDPEWGEQVSAAVVLAPGIDGRDRETILRELQTHARRHLADYKKPRSLQVVEELPRNALGKVQKTALKRAAALRCDERPLRATDPDPR